MRFVIVRPTEAPTTAAAAKGARSISDMVRFTHAVSREPLDVFFSPSVYTYFPLPPGLRAVVTVHDAIAERFPELTLPSRRAQLFWNAKVRLALRQSRLVLSVSEYARRDIEAIHGFPADRIRVAVEAPADAYQPVHDAVAISDAAAAVGVPPGARWLTYVGGFNPHKNVGDLVRAHARYVTERAPRDPLHLVLVGPTDGDVFHGNLDRIREDIARAGTEHLVHWPGFVPDHALAHLHSGAIALYLVSAAEGFGLPAVEAAACGCPVLATVESPLPELLAGGGVFLRPGDEDGLFRALTTLVEEPGVRDELARKALERARLMSWPAAADAAMDALRAAAA